MTNESSFDFHRIKRKSVSKYSMIGPQQTQQFQIKKLISSKKFIKVMLDIKKEDFKKIQVFRIFPIFVGFQKKMFLKLKKFAISKICS